MSSYGQVTMPARIERELSHDVQDLGSLAPAHKKELQVSCGLSSSELSLTGTIERSS
jgi:hypothetical protein